MSFLHKELIHITWFLWTYLRTSKVCPNDHALGVTLNMVGACAVGSNRWLMRRVGRAYHSRGFHEKTSLSNRVKGKETQRRFVSRMMRCPSTTMSLPIRSWLPSCDSKRAFQAVEKYPKVDGGERRTMGTRTSCKEEKARFRKNSNRSGSVLVPSFTIRSSLLSHVSILRNPLSLVLFYIETRGWIGSLPIDERVWM